jgi:hypothetical protein
MKPIFYLPHFDRDLKVFSIIMENGVYVLPDM